MKSQKNELVYFILTLVLLVFIAFTYLIFNKNTQASKPQGHTPRVQVIPSNSYQAVETAIAKAESDPNESNLNLAQEAVSQVADTNKRLELQARLDALLTEATNQVVATTAVETAEASLVRDDIATAQEAINQLTNEAKKAELQARLTAISQAQ